MARTERGATERWPEVAPRGRDWESEEWEEPQRAPIVNPYAIIALVAALLGLFPVALVFGLVSFSHPRGRGLAVFALLIGLLEVAALVGFVVLGGNGLRDLVNRTDRAQTAPATAPQAVRTPAIVPPTTSAAASSTPVVAEAGTPAKGQVCAENQVGLIGTAGDGGTLICLFKSGVNGGYRWAGPYTVAGGVQQTGTSCDPTGQKSARTTDGKALVCEGQGRNAMWVPWTE
ncbi:hypothetical protein D5S18_19750 [Nocardia panacis]|uniref:DUF4190 domain-containing protein n=1 Tax=Nocardia panacis TaxID=2340916 RepID=A0A3A4KKE6_9NOCA|nr:DUF4190 domain-containing protein [Nocardia panacis]RJO73457.1 hypothetical protein D5S18_19750 [Nocardia panacis]